MASSLLRDRRSLLLLSGASLATLLSASSPEGSPLLPAAQAAEGAPAAAADRELVLVVGSTGQTGRRVVQQLRARGFKVRAGVRDIKKGQGLGLSADPGVELVLADVLKPDQLAAAMVGVQAVICATGYSGSIFTPSGFGEVDETGTKNLVDAANKAGVPRFVLLSSLLTNATAVGQAENPNYKFLNIFGGVLDHKLVAENYLRASGMTWTVVRPGGLSNQTPAEVGNLVVSGEDSLFGLDGDVGREISRDTVAEVLAATLKQDSSKNKVVEVVAALGAPKLKEEQWFP